MANPACISGLKLLSKRAQEEISPLLPTTLVCYVNQNMLSLSCLVNMDEVSVLFALSSRYTLDKKRISAGRSSLKITDEGVVLACTGDGHKKRPAVILAKTKDQVRSCQDFAGAHVWLQEKDSMNTDIVRS